MIHSHTNNIPDKLISSQDPEKNDQYDVDLNQVLETVCNGFIAEGKSFILRSDKLPHVLGDEEVFLHLFKELVAMILNHPPQNSKLFLYVTCREDNPDEDVIDMRLTGDIRLFRTNFYTNITSDDQWTDLYKEDLAANSLLVEQNGGNFSFFPICNTGCLFSISLPGKIK